MLAIDSHEFAPEKQGPFMLAERMAQSCNDVSTIFAAVTNRFGRGSSPEKSTIRGFIEHRQRMDKKRKGYVGEPTEDDGEHWQVPSTLRPPRPQPRTIDFILIEPRNYPRLPCGNPWLNRAQLSLSVMQSVGDAFGMSVREIVGHSRLKKYMLPRAICSKLLSECGLSLADVGRRMGGRDHSTIRHQVNEIFPRIEREPAAASVYYRHVRLRNEADAIVEEPCDEA